MMQKEQDQKYPLTWATYNRLYVSERRAKEREDRIRKLVGELSKILNSRNKRFI